MTKVLPGQRCRHCGHTVVNRPRGLCWACHRTPEIREMYPARGNAGVYGAKQKEIFGALYPASHPCHNRPGTVGKFLELCRRYAAREELFHPDDAKM